MGKRMTGVAVMREERAIVSWRMEGFEPGTFRDVEVAGREYVDHFWLRADVPGDVHTTLREAGVIPDPFVGHSDWGTRWVEQRVWWYRGHFFMEEGALHSGDTLELVFEGLDTLATIYVNGRELGRHANMFVPVSFDVTRELVAGDNVVAVKLDPIAAAVREKDLSLWAAFNRERVWVRKAQSHFGWDWGPNIVPCGIWRPVLLRRHRGMIIRSAQVRTLSAGEERARVRVEVDVEGPLIGDAAAGARVRVCLWEGDRKAAVSECSLDGDRAAADLEVPEPRLWWTFDLGEPYLYRMEITLVVRGEEVDRREHPVGLRTVTLLREENGEPRFTFVLNGRPIFAKGANWVPADQFVGALPDGRYVRLLRAARNAGMNMIRVWGGGLYEREIFYDTCDRLGILVWQDFMFACALYPDYNKDFLENVKMEIESVVRRLRRHPSLALWCGNNENDWLWEMMVSDGRLREPFYGERIYHRLIPETLRRLDPERPYRPSSPYGGTDHNSAEEGDRHNWQVWHGHVYPRRFGEPERVDRSVPGVSFKQYLRDTARFVSEFGIQASANRYTLERWIPPGKLEWGGPELEYRNKDAHPEKAMLLMAGYTGIPETFDQYLMYSMLTQAEGLRLAVEHYRRRKFATSGALIWQLNDCWPGISWSIIDYEGLPKAAYYYAKRFFHPYLLTLEEQGDEWVLWAVWDGWGLLRDEVQVEVVDFQGNRLKVGRWPVRVPDNGRQEVVRLSRKEWLARADVREAAVALRSTSGRTPVRWVYLCDQMEMRLPPATLQARILPGGRAVRVETDVHARMVLLETPGRAAVFRDNYFDMAAGESRTVELSQDDPNPLDRVTVRCLNNSCEPRGGPLAQAGM
ncbi:MAG: glycoside hydrolase family 2 protein [Kyrpidia sp.]|nr:glycoside hydrolase family 2 protein [Kyrpidia sp.]